MRSGTSMPRSHVTARLAPRSAGKIDGMTSKALRRSLAHALVLLTATSALAADPTLPPATWLLDQVKTLSAPEMDGRGSGTPGAERASQYIARVFTEAGLKPGGDNGTFFQSFPVSTGIKLGGGNALTIVAPTARDLTLGKEFLPLAVSADGSAEGDVIFVGYGITARDLNYDDYADLDVRDKIVLAMTGEPRSNDPSSPFRRPEAYHYSERSHKIINAREHGARAILLVAHPGAPRQALPPLRGITQPWNILAGSLTGPVADTLLAPGGKRLADLAAEIDQKLAPQSSTLPGVRVRLAVSLQRERGTAANVVGILPGTDEKLRDEAIVIGAHYDHLGRGGEGSLAPDQVGTIHPGADDNGSGTAAVLGLARAFAAAGGAPRTLVFVTFAGEEMGLLGSAHFGRPPPPPPHPARPLG